MRMYMINASHVYQSHLMVNREEGMSEKGAREMEETTEGRKEGWGKPKTQYCTSSLSFVQLIHCWLRYGTYHNHNSYLYSTQRSCTSMYKQTHSYMHLYPYPSSESVQSLLLTLHKIHTTKMIMKVEE